MAKIKIFFKKALLMFEAFFVISKYFLSLNFFDTLGRISIK